MFGLLLVGAVGAFLLYSRFVHERTWHFWMPYIIIAIIAARIFHVLRFYTEWDAPLLALIYWKTGGLSVWGAVYGIILYHLYKYRYSFIPALNAIIPELAFFSGLVSVIFFSVPEGFGTYTDSFLGISPRLFSFMSLPEAATFHPLFLYSALLWFGVWLITILNRKFRVLIWWIAFGSWYLIVHRLSSLDPADYYLVFIWYFTGIVLYLGTSDFVIRRLKK